QVLNAGLFMKKFIHRDIEKTRAEVHVESGFHVEYGRAEGSRVGFHVKPLHLLLNLKFLEEHIAKVFNVDHPIHPVPVEELHGTLTELIEGPGLVPVKDRSEVGEGTRVL